MFTQSDLDLFSKALDALKRPEKRPDTPALRALRSIAQEMQEETENACKAVDALSLKYFVGHRREFCESVAFTQEAPLHYADIAPYVRSMRLDG